jgi:hypothetical protein
MWPVVKRSLVIGAVCLAGVGGTAYAEFTDVLEVKVPFPFIVGNHTLPAGQYSIEREDDMGGALVIRGEHGTAGSAVLNTIPASGREAGGEHPAIEFKRMENNEYRLQTIWTGDGLDRAVVVR